MTKNLLSIFVCFSMNTCAFCQVPRTESAVKTWIEWHAEISSDFSSEVNVEYHQDYGIPGINYHLRLKPPFRSVIRLNESPDKTHHLMGAATIGNEQYSGDLASSTNDVWTIKKLVPNPGSSGPPVITNMGSHHIAILRCGNLLKSLEGEYSAIEHSVNADEFSSTISFPSINGDNSPSQATVKFSKIDGDFRPLEINIEFLGGNPPQRFVFEDWEPFKIGLPLPRTVTVFTDKLHDGKVPASTWFVVDYRKFGKKDFEFCRVTGFGLPEPDRFRKRVSVWPYGLGLGVFLIVCSYLARKRFSSRKT